jgi:hypothetical protein
MVLISPRRGRLHDCLFRASWATCSGRLCRNAVLHPWQPFFRGYPTGKMKEKIESWDQGSSRMLRVNGLRAKQTNHLDEVSSRPEELPGSLPVNYPELRVCFVCM